MSVHLHRGSLISCACGWRGAPTYEGGRIVRPIRYVETPTGRVEQIPGKREGSKPSKTCPACKGTTDG